SVYEAGLAAGTVIAYHENGKIQKKQLYKDGKPYGDPAEYDEKGKLKGTKPKKGKFGEFLDLGFWK
ncbi:MAG: hypothetical protein GY749_19285, partial [Desulfobacteraceae bacterium]|nr:hypothetical protein [Desulfobacteraceae bacterium]